MFNVLLIIWYSHIMHPDPPLTPDVTPPQKKPSLFCIVHILTGAVQTPSGQPTLVPRKDVSFFTCTLDRGYPGEPAEADEVLGWLYPVPMPCQQGAGPTPLHPIPLPVPP